MAAFTAWLTANGATLGTVGVVAAVLFGVMNPDKVKGLFTKFSAGDFSGFAAGLKKLPLLKGLKVADSEVKNIASYGEMKIYRERVVKVVDAADVVTTQQYCDGILANLAKASVQAPVSDTTTTVKTA